MRPVRRELLLNELRRTARYLAVGLTGLAIDVAAFTLISQMGQGRAISRAGSIAVATCCTWAINRKVTFTSTGRRRREELLRYATVAACAQGVNYSLFLVLSALAPSLHPQALIPVCAVASGAISYTGQRLFTFRPTPPAAS